MTDAQAQLVAMKVLIDRATGAIAEATMPIRLTPTGSKS